VNCDNRYLARGGLGAVLGSKNLKAIAVKGTGSIVLADKDKFRKVESEIRELLKEDPEAQRVARTGMAGGGAVAYNEMGMLPIKNFQEVDFEGASLTGYEQVKRYYRDIIPCPNDCPLKCDRLIEIDKREPYGGTTVSSMEATPAYNTAKLLIADMNTTIKAFELCNAYGIDMHSWTGVMAWAIECFERKILTNKDTDELELKWGDGPLLLESIRRIALREGMFGDLLAEGVAMASRKIGQGSEKYAMHMKGMELDDELRVDLGMSLGIMTETRGAGHTLGAFFGSFDRNMPPEKAKKLFGTENAAKAHVYDDKADLVVLTERHRAIQDCLGLCSFSTWTTMMPQTIEKYNMQTYAELLSAATGLSLSEEELIRIAERVLAIEKSINILSGISRQDEFPPDRFFEPIPGGRSKGLALDKEKVIEALKRHSELHKWDPVTGVPTREGLLDLDLEEVASKLEAAGKY
jgi:aldehyde:ferredoxin oxidoreductase